MQEDGLTMRIVKTLAKQDSNTTLRAVLSTMHSVVAHKTVIGCKEQIHIRTSQPGQHVEHYTIHGRKDRDREMGLWEELDQVHVMIVRHGGLFYSSPFSFTYLYMTCSLQEESLWQLQNNKARREEITDVGLRNTIGDGVRGEVGPVLDIIADCRTQRFCSRLSTTSRDCDHNGHSNYIYHREDGRE
jgi:hypothetical protein